MLYDSQYYSFPLSGPLTYAPLPATMPPIDWSWNQGVPTAVQQGQLPTEPPFGTWRNNSYISSLQQQQQQSQAPQKRLSIAGRKRSRQEMSETLDDDSTGSSPPAHPLASSHVSTPKGEPVYGPGMTLIYPDDPAYTSAIGANSQTGTWAEELAERMRSNSLEEYPGAKRMNLESRKSMKMDRDAAQLDDVRATVYNGRQPRASSASDDAVIDEASRALGIGWSTIPTNTVMDAACRGWARYIENNFPLQSAKIVWKNKALPAFLVSAATRDAGRYAGTSGYYLFSDDLSQGKLVAKSWGRTLDNLRGNPIVYDGTEVLELGMLDRDEAMSEGMVVDGISGVHVGPAAVLAGGGAGGMDID